MICGDRRHQLRRGVEVFYHAFNFESIITLGSMANAMRAAIVKVNQTLSYPREARPDIQVFSTKHSLTLPAAALSYIEEILREVCQAEPIGSALLMSRMISRKTSGP